MQSFQFPAAPIDVEAIAQAMNFKVEYDELFGPAGYTFKVPYKSDWRYYIAIASDMDYHKYSPLQIHYRQRFTLAHEIGHILLHNHLDWNSVETNLHSILEVEANWFASRLLMPDYIFKSVKCLEPEYLSHTCQVNYQAAQKRINYLDKHITSQLIRESTDIAYLSSFSEIAATEYDFDFSDYYDEISNMSLDFIDEDKNVVCFVCGNVNGSTEVLPLYCYNCSSPLF